MKKTAGLILTLAALTAAQTAQAGVARLEIESREILDGTFGGAGAYERISGRFFGELDPNDPANTIINDIELAPTNARGMVEYSATFQLARPVDMSKASGFLFYNVPNRGRGAATGDPDGHIRVVSGWQGDIPARPGVQSASVPVARNADGSPVTGPVVVRFIDMREGSQSLPIVAGLAGGVPQPPPATMRTETSRLVRRAGDDEQGVVLAPESYAFADCSQTPFPGTPDPGQLCLRGGFDPDYAYELTYIAKDPPVLGIGFAATRDLNAFLRYGASTQATPNPVEGAVDHVIAVGVSQSGNYLRTFLHLGFNRSEDGRMVFDGMNPQIAGRYVPLNLRFGVPGGASGLYEPGSEGPLWWSRYDDTARGQGEHSLLDRCNATGTCPKIMETFGAAEFWGLRMSPNLVGTRADIDIPLPDNVRRYYFAGVTHGGGRGGFEVLDREAGGTGACALPANPNPTGPYLAALTKALTAWVADGAEMPPSLYPTLAEGDLVEPTAADLGFPQIPGYPGPNGRFLHFYRYDFGPGYEALDVSGRMSRVPPAIAEVLPSKAVRVDSDGNEVAGLMTVHARVPLGTYLGWNVQARGYYAGDQCGFTGGYIPFAETRADRLASGDPRPSLEERYGDHAGFVSEVRAAAQALVEDGYLLPVDAEEIIRDAEASEVLTARE